MNNWDLYTIGNYIIGKYPSGNAFNSEEFAQQFNYCQVLYSKKLLGLPEEYQPMSPAQRYGYGITYKLDSDLETFIVSKGHNVGTPFAFSNGFANIPSDFMLPIGMSINTQDSSGKYSIPIEFVNRGEFIMRKGSSLKNTVKYPVVSMLNGRMSILPSTITSANFDYLRYPNDIVVATTINGTTGEEEYDAANSTESEWRDVCNYDILAIMLQKIGVNIRSTDIINYAMGLEQKGT